MKTTKKIWTFKYISGKQIENHEIKSELSNIFYRKPQNKSELSNSSAKNRLKTTKISELSNISAENRLKTTKKNLNFQIYQRKTDWKSQNKSEISNISAENRLKTTKKSELSNISAENRLKTTKKIWTFKNISGKQTENNEN